MPSADIRETRIEYEVAGTGERNLLLIPGGVVSDAFRPLASELTRASSNDLRVVTIHRRGYGGSSRPPSPFSLEDQAGDCVALLDHLDLRTAHVAGHSLSGLIALQMAQDAPERVASLTLIEPSLIRFVPGPAQAGQGMAEALTRYQSGDRAGAVDTFMRGVGGEDYRSAVDRVLPPGWFEQAGRDLDTFFPIELPAIRSWRFESRDRVTQPILSVYGTEKRWGGTAASGEDFDRMVRTWFAHAASLPIRGAYHWPHITHTEVVAAELSRFAAGDTP